MFALRQFAVFQLVACPPCHCHKACEANAGTMNNARMTITVRARMRIAVFMQLPFAGKQSEYGVKWQQCGRTRIHPLAAFNKP